MNRYCLLSTEGGAARVDLVEKRGQQAFEAAELPRADRVGVVAP
jgi:hypothetical protein